MSKRLNMPDLRAAGIPAPWGFGLADQVRFSELDILNHVNNAAYVTWLENARVAWLMDTGLNDYKSPKRPTIVLRHLEISFDAPLFLDDRYVVTARTGRIGRSSWIMEQAVFKAGRIAASATGVMVSVSADGSRKLPLSDAMLDVLKADQAPDFSR